MSDDDRVDLLVMLASGARLRLRRVPMRQWRLADQRDTWIELDGHLLRGEHVEAIVPAEDHPHLRLP